MTEQHTPPPEAGFFTTIRGWGIARGDERVFGGVSSGIAQRLGWRLGWTRVGVLAVVIFVSGFGALAYAAAWALLPDREGRIVAQDFGRGVPNVGALIMIGIIGIAGLIGLSDAGTLPFGWGGGWPVEGAWDGSGHGVFSALAVIARILIPLAVLAGVVGLIIWLVRRNRTVGSPGAPADGTPPVYAAPPAWAAARQAEREAHATPSAGYATPGPIPAVPPIAPIPPRPPRIPGPGAGFYLLTLAWLVLSAAGVAWAEWTDRLAVHPLLAWFALFVTGLGVILALVAVTGRRLGFLAFMSAVLLIPTAVMIAQADRVMDGWGDHWLPQVSIERDSAGDVVRFELGRQTYWVREDGNIVTEDPEPTETATPDPDTSVLDKFDQDYQRIMLPAGCYASREPLDQSGVSVGLVDESLLNADQAVTVTAGFTTVRIPRGSGLDVAVGEFGTATIHWVERGVTCDVWDGSPVTLVSSDQPTLTLTVDNPEDYASIVIEEVAP